MSIFSTTQIAGLSVQLHVAKAEKEGAVNTVSLVFPELKDKKGKELSISRRAFSNALDFSDTLKTVEMPEAAKSMAIQAQVTMVNPVLASAVSSCTEFLAGLAAQLKHYDDETKPEQAGVVRPENGLAAFLASAFTWEQLSKGLTDEEILAEVKAHMPKAKDKLNKMHTSNGLKADGKLMMRPEKKEKEEKEESVLA